MANSFVYLRKQESVCVRGSACRLSPASDPFCGHHPNPDHLQLQQWSQLPNGSPCCFLLPSFPSLLCPPSEPHRPVKLSGRACLTSLLPSPSGFPLGVEGKLTGTCGLLCLLPSPPRRPLPGPLPCAAVPSSGSLLLEQFSHTIAPGPLHMPSRCRWPCASAETPMALPHPPGLDGEASRPPWNVGLLKARPF